MPAMSDRYNSTTNSSVNRRNVLRSIGATGATAAGLSGVASADTRREFSAAEIEAVRSEYRDLESIESALAEEQELLDALSEEGIIPRATVSTLGIETLGKPSSPGDMNVTVTPADTDDGVTPRIVVDGVIGESVVSLKFEPDTENAQAIVKRPSASEFEQLYSAGSSGCGSDCDNCKCTCSSVNMSVCCSWDYSKNPAECQGYKQEPDCYCNDGW
ncbi:hypothetical protein HZS55_17085 [Halosimplex rubrum]|uniref:Uncharacterized protein n=1 Tax=Halosimplex rubrum TaxID=869889 RepID=A0A7D5PBC9_9EURY|nr:hypothetical protein [Halosimplex rubrum]QLH78900.1 hypothetical protein HZS55_17085 [Halosimplex rubrum]